jgi:hypothetical protein
MALPILDGNQSATTLSTILSSGQHITAHTVVSLGTQAITDIVNATSAGLTNTQLRASAVTVGGTVTVGNSVTISSLPAISGTVSVRTDLDANSGLPCVAVAFDSIGGVQRVGANNGFPIRPMQDGAGNSIPLAISGTVTIGSALPTGTNSIGVVTIGAGTVTIGAGTAQIGSVTASISGTVPISISSVTIGNSITIGSLPAISGTVTANVFGTNSINQIPLNMTVEGDGFANGNRLAVSIIDDQGAEYGTSSPLIVSGTVTVGNTVAIAGTVTANPTGTQTISGSVTLAAGTAQIGSVTASISNSVTIASLPAISGTVTANTFALQGTAVTTSNFTSTTASTVLANFNASREVLTIFNEGAGNLHICAGATCTTIAYQVRLSAGDYYEVPNHQTTITHSAVFATAGTARVTQVS